MPPKDNNNRDLLRYAGLTTQLFFALGLSLYIGLKLDAWLHISSPVLVWVIPLLVIIAVIYKLIKETNRKK